MWTWYSPDIYIQTTGPAGSCLRGVPVPLLAPLFPMPYIASTVIHNSFTSAANVTWKANARQRFAELLNWIIFSLVIILPRKNIKSNYIIYKAINKDHTYNLYIFNHLFLYISASFYKEQEIWDIQHFRKCMHIELMWKNWDRKTTAWQTLWKETF